jgi:hypothetical protein
MIGGQAEWPFDGMVAPDDGYFFDGAFFIG